MSTERDPKPGFDGARLGQQIASNRGRSRRGVGVGSLATFASFAGIFALIVAMMDKDFPSAAKNHEQQSLWADELKSSVGAALSQGDAPSSSRGGQEARQPDVFNRYQHHHTPWVLKSMASASQAQPPQPLEPATHQPPPGSDAVTKPGKRCPTAQERQEMERVKKEMERFMDSRILAGRYGESTPRGRGLNRQGPGNRDHSSMSAASASSFDTDFSSVGGD